MTLVRFILALAVAVFVPACQGTGYGDYQQAVFVDFVLTTESGDVLVSPKIVARKNRAAEIMLDDNGHGFSFWIRPEHWAGGPFKGKMRFSETMPDGQVFEYVHWLDLDYRGEWSFPIELSNGPATLEISMRLHPRAEMEETLGLPRILHDARFQAQ